MTIFRGLPASGKTTKSLELMKKHGNTVRINKDSLRTMLHGDVFNGYNESITRSMSRMIAKECLRDGINVIIDDTNLNPRTEKSWTDLAVELNSKIEYQNMSDISVEECIKRDETREKKVGKSVIQKMGLQYLDYWKGQKVVISDLDGTLCNIDHRLKYAKGEDKNWKKFFEGIKDDILRKEVFDKILDYNVGVRLILVSARPETYRSETEEWLADNGVFFDALIMREDNDKRDDTLVKQDMYEKYLKNLNIIKVFDDRPRIVRMWREKGLEVEDVGSGVEF